MSTHNILIVDDEAQNRDFLSEILLEENYAVTSVANGKDAVAKLSQDNFHVVLTDLQMPEIDGLGVIRYLIENRLNCIGVIYTGYGSVKTAVDAMKLGAFDYITKPFKADEIKVVVKKALDHLALQEENAYLKQQLKAKYKFENIIGTSDRMQRVFSMIDKVASTDSTVLILGESGTGKELVARALHYNSPRAQNPFVPVNCGAIPEELLESELFGHEKGAFTGAFRARIGRFELAHSGSIFLDEVSEMSPNLQVKLLRVIQEREFERVGGVKSIRTDVRIIAATNKNLEEEVEQGRFREDLYYRLNVIPMNLPPLRERRDDIPLLVKHFLAKYGKEKNPSLTGFSRKAMNLLMQYKWPGNVRELENLVERLLVLCDGPEVDTCDLPDKILAGAVQTTSAVPHIDLPESGIDLSSAVSEFEKSIIIQALNRSNWVKNRAAKLLHVNRTTLVEKIKKQKLQRPVEVKLG
ncbi:MAG: Transcriptional regulatory protein ZraR [Deltaproteobacteria bacterium ADurb.BinA179]|jgi:DNA-binding NtrC family response regulator|nr:sigma-54-dependent Fis family transcriptional regulator [Deltaproteobacteria bacterium]NLW68111.1 sigma-54-dependent Fis family transcriptional regulator [Bacteriovoracaceae bacterium]OPZ26451.1 MAG: Transcriptional regulatory protein ZraR [Deltaproteobacteria bacterium ADurb.BinA179]HRR20866.1 sigma-54 dependent transcriptional regulator [Desulfomonilia bacterium]HNR50429.1 sigma-54 dependent transcriptional regulator [Deltaproteobacteria bacterium]